jgi:hypothetical protein
MSYQPGDRLTQRMRATCGPEGSRTSLTYSQTLPSSGAYGCPEQQPFAGQGMQGGNLQYLAAVSAETLPPQQPQQISPQQYHPYQGQAIYNIVPPYPQRHTAAVEVLSSLQQYRAPSEPASSIPAAQTTFVTPQYELMHFPPQTLAIGPATTQKQQQIMPSLDNIDDAYNIYRRQLKATFKAINSGRLAKASVEIMNLSRWLLTNVVKLGELLSALRAG